MSGHAKTTLAMLREAEREGISVEADARRRARAERLEELADEFDAFAEECPDALECRVRDLEASTRDLADALEEIGGDLSEFKLADRLHTARTGQGGGA